MSDIEIELLKAEAEEAAARARVEVYRRALGTRAPDRLRTSKAKPARAAAPPREMTDIEKAAAQKLARDMGVPVIGRGR
jgi:hypothetical protein